MDLLQNQEKQFYEDQLSLRKGQISEEVDEDYERERKFIANFATAPARPR